MPDYALTAFRWATAMIKQFPILSSISVLMLILGIGLLIYIATHLITGIPIAISRVQMQGAVNYVGFPVERHELDAQLISYGEITITNISATEKVALDFMLHITDPGVVDITSKADLIGPFGMILGKDDNAAKRIANLPFGEAPKYFRNPVELEPRQIERKRLVFLFNVGPLRDNVAMILIHPLKYKFDLEIKDLLSDRAIVIHLPGEYRGDKENN